MRNVKPTGLPRYARPLLKAGLVLALGLPGVATAGEGELESGLAKIAPSESEQSAPAAQTEDSQRTTLESLTTLAGYQFFPDKESDGLVLHEFSAPDESTVRGAQRHSSLKLIRYDRHMQFLDNEVVLKVRTPGKRRSLMSLELKF
jgi:hypothetical protein